MIGDESQLHEAMHIMERKRIEAIKKGKGEFSNSSHSRSPNKIRIGKQFDSSAGPLGMQITSSKKLSGPKKPKKPP